MVTYGFFNSLNGDRKYFAEQFGALFDNIITDGVIMGIGENLFTVPGDGMQVIVEPGRAWFDHTWTLNDAGLPLNIDASDSLYGRIDAVVLEVNHDDAVRANSIKIVKGIAASSPAKPVLTDSGDVHQHPLAWVTVRANATSITGSDIDIQVGKAPTLFCTSVLQATDIETLFQKWDSDFTVWFDNIKAQLDGNVAANLQKQIDELNGKLQDIKDALEVMGYDKAIVKLTVVDQTGKKLRGVKVRGMSSAMSATEDCFTGSNGIAKGYISGNVSTKLEVSHETATNVEHLIDIDYATVTVKGATGSIIEETLTVKTNSVVKITATNSNVVFSGAAKSIDVFAVGGGGGGGRSLRDKYTDGDYRAYTSLMMFFGSSGYYPYKIGLFGGGGGGGGNITTKKIFASSDFIPHTKYSATIGSGGTGGKYVVTNSSTRSNTDAKDGGDTSFLSIIAKGGIGGSRAGLDQKRGSNINVTEDITEREPSKNGGGNAAYVIYHYQNGYYETVKKQNATNGSEGTKGPDDTVYGSGGGAGGLYHNFNSDTSPTSTADAVKDGPLTLQSSSGGTNAGGSPASTSSVSDLNGTPGASNTGSGGGGGRLIYSTVANGTYSGGDGGSGVLIFTIDFDYAS